MTHTPTTALSVANPWSVVPSLGNLDAYITAVNRLPMLSQAEETSLARRLRDEGDIQAAGQLVLSHLRFVVHIARGYHGYGLPLGDLIQEGNVCLMKAVKRFDPEHGVRLVSFTLGARVRDLVGATNSLLLNAEGAYHLVLGSADLVLGAHGGYFTVTNAGGGSGGNVVSTSVSTTTSRRSSPWAPGPRRASISAGAILSSASS